MVLANYTKLKFQGPANYRISIEGDIPEGWLSKFGNMELKKTYSKVGKCRSTLKGVILDQAQLMGILQSIYDLHLSVIEVKWIKK